MKISRALAFDIHEITEEVIYKLNKFEDISKRKITSDAVTSAIFEWLDNWYLPSKMRWAENPSPALNVFCTPLAIDYGDLPKGSGYQKAVDYLEMEFNDILADILPRRTWKALFVKRISATSFVFEVGEDYRVVWYMTNVHNKPKT